MQQAIVDFALDDENHWYAILACGHTQHVRHDPPWQNRPWVITEQGRNEKLGVMLECKKCDEEMLLRITTIMLNRLKNSGSFAIVTLLISIPSF